MTYLGGVVAKMRDFVNASVAAGISEFTRGIGIRFEYQSVFFLLQSSRPWARVVS